jgi:hypothetical protein
MASAKTTATPPGMLDRSSWRRTETHQHSSYACGRCGIGVSDPLAVYVHLAKCRQRGVTGRRERRRRSASTSPEVQAA